LQTYRKQLPKKLIKENYQITTPSFQKKISRKQLQTHQRKLTENSSNSGEKLPEKTPNLVKKFLEKQLKVQNLPGNSSKPTKKIIRESSKPIEPYQRTAPNPGKKLPENSSKSDEEIIRKQLQIWRKKISKKSSKSGEENYYKSSEETNRNLLEAEIN
ncbi:6162_t:CDS:2, partial [Ambispora leptoticha]